MSRFAGRVTAPAARKAPSSQPPAPQPRRAAPQRGPLWHAIQLKAAQSAGAASGRSSRSGLPAPLKAGVEALSGIAMDDVRVHRNSAKPARLGALAYTKGSDIHLGPGQERHLPHEAWHVVQQKQGRVAATAQMKGVAVNQDRALEREADLMGARAAGGADGGGALAPTIATTPIVQYRVEKAVDPMPIPSAVGKTGKELDLDLGVKPSEIPAEGKGKDEKQRIAVLAEVALAHIKQAFVDAKDTIALDAKLQRIKAELGLRAIVLVDVGKPSARVAFEINPWLECPVPSSTEIGWKMTGTYSTPVTYVEWLSDTLPVGTASANVGKHMIANPLAPDHEPGSVSTYDSAQDPLMGELANSGNTSVPNDQKYIKGHLLNDHVGGPGRSFNLFPITADANAKHLAYVEKYLKAQLAAQNVVYYEVKVTHGSATALASSSSTGSAGYSIDSVFNFGWHLLDIKGAKLGTTHINQIHSNYNAVGAAPFDVTVEYAGEYDKLNRGKNTPKAINKTDQWQVSYSSPDMAPMGIATKSKTPFSMSPGLLGGSSPATTSAALDFTGIPVKTDSGADFISIRNKDAPDASAVGSDMLISVGSSPTTVKITSISPLSGGWTRIYF